MQALLLSVLLQFGGSTSAVETAPAPQTSWPTAADYANPQQVPQPISGSPVRVGVLTPGVQAAQPTFGTSSSDVVRTQRIDTGLARGNDGRLMVRVRDLASVRGMETNTVQGIGLVTGLAASGDSGLPARQAIANLLLTQNINLDPSQLASNNVAMVWIDASLPPGIKPGQRLDGRVSSIYDAESLVGGTLVWGELTSPTGDTVYATASGPITVGGFGAGGDGAEATRNHLTVGLIPEGVKVEREVPTRIVSPEGAVYLDLRAKTGSFGNAVRIADAIAAVYPGAAVPIDGMTVRVATPGGLAEYDRVRFVNSLLALELNPEASSRVVINERTGTLVLGEEVRLGRGAITKGNLTVTIAETPEVSQPAPLSEGQTAIVPRTSLLIEEEDRPLSIINGAASLAEVVEVLNVLGVSPRDMIEILQAMAQSGMLHAELVVQ
ncbi:MAG: flagellar basal body P-ring protein FlgI [Planctomycetota bacterium]